MGGYYLSYRGFFVINQLTITAIAGLTALILVAATANQSVFQIKDYHGITTMNATGSGNLAMSGVLALKGPAYAGCPTKLNNGKLTVTTTGAVVCADDISGGGTTGGGGSGVNTGGVLQIGNAKYVRKQGDTMTGVLAINIQGGNLNTVGLNVVNTISGASLHADKYLSTSGTLVFEGAASGSSLYLGTSLQGAGLTTCSNGVTSKLLWNNATGRFSCGVDQNTANTYTAGQGLVLTTSTFSLGATITGSLVRFQTISGSTVFAKATLTTSGAVKALGNISGATLNINNLQNCTNVQTNSAGRLACNSAVYLTADQTQAGQGLTLNGTSLKVNAILTGALLSFTTINATQGLNSSGTLTVEGAISGASLFVGTSMQGAGLVTCSNSITSKLLWNSATGRFSCGVDQDANTTYTAGQGLALNATSFSVNSTLTGSLASYQTLSGAVIKGARSVTSSGTIVAEGAISGASLYAATSIQGAGLVDCANGITSKLLWTAASGRFSCGVDQDANTTYTAGQGLTLTTTSFKTNAILSGSLLRFLTVSGSTVFAKNSLSTSGSLKVLGNISGSTITQNGGGNNYFRGNVGIGDINPVTPLEVWGTISGTTLYAQQSLRSSGSLVWEGAASGASLYVGSSIKGAGLVADCNSASSALQWTASTGRFSCGSISGGSGISQTAADARYVRKSGDTMTGGLIVRLAGDNPVVQTTRFLSDIYNPNYVGTGTMIMKNFDPNALGGSGSIKMFFSNTNNATNDAAILEVAHIGGNSISIISDQDSVNGLFGTTNAGGTFEMSVSQLDSSRTSLQYHIDPSSIDLVSGAQWLDINVAGTSYYNGAGSFAFGKTNAKAKLDVLGTISGSLLTLNGGGNSYIASNLRIGDRTNAKAALDVNGALSGASLVIGGGITLRNVAYSAPKTLAAFSGQSLISSTAGVMEWGDAVESDLPAKAFQALGSVMKGFTIGSQGIPTTTAATMTDGQARFTAVWLPKAATITGIKVNMITAGAYTGDNNNYVALYTYSAGNLTQVAISANNSTLWTATASTYLTIPFSSTYAAQPGLYFVGTLYNSSAQTTAPAIAATMTPNISAASADFTNSAKISGGIVTQTALTTPIASSAITVNNNMPWIALY